MKKDLADAALQNVRTATKLMPVDNRPVMLAAVLCT